MTRARSDSIPLDVASSKSQAQLDAMLNHVAGYDPAKAVCLTAGNNNDDALLNEAKKQLCDWFPAPMNKS